MSAVDRSHVSAVQRAGLFSYSWLLFRHIDQFCIQIICPRRSGIFPAVFHPLAVKTTLFVFDLVPLKAIHDAVDICEANLGKPVDWRRTSLTRTADHQKGIAERKSPFLGRLEIRIFQ